MKILFASNINRHCHKKLVKIIIIIILIMAWKWLYRRNSQKCNKYTNYFTTIQKTEMKKHLFNNTDNIVCLLVKKLILLLSKDTLIKNDSKPLQKSFKKIIIHHNKKCFLSPILTYCNNFCRIT